MLKKFLIVILSLILTGIIFPFLINDIPLIISIILVPAIFFVIFIVIRKSVI